MQLRRSLATATAVLALAAPLSGCGIRGFDYPTERVYTPGAGTNNTSGDVDVLSAAVVSGADDRGTLIVTLVNGSEEERTLTGLSGKRVVTSEGVEPTPVEFAEFEPVAVEPGQSVNFAEPPLEITLTGTFSAGNFLEVTFEFDDGERVAMSVPVVDDESSYWQGLDAS